MSVNKNRDAQAVARFKAGDPYAFEELVSRYEGRIYGFLSKMCLSPDNARDMVQETFLTAFRYLKNFRGDSSFKTWLYKVASTACLRSRRKRKNEPAYHLSFEELLPGEAERREGFNREWYNTPAEALLNAELNEHIQMSLAELPEKYRVVFVLKELEGFSNQEIAKTLDLSIPAVKSRLHRARLFLRKELAEYYLKEKGG